MNTQHPEPAAYFDVVSSPIGALTLACAEGGALCEIALDTERARAARTSLGHAPRRLRRAKRQLAEYFAGKRFCFDLVLAPQGTPFQLAVWRVLAAIPYGEVRSYRSIADQLGSSNACRAVGAANGRNPLPIVVPCHRVIGSDGTLTGYAGGLPLKRFLLGLEGRARASTRASAANAR